MWPTDTVCLCCVVTTGLSGPEEGLGAGLDSCVLPTRHEGISIVQTTDLYPLSLPPQPSFTLQGNVAFSKGCSPKGCGLYGVKHGNANLSLCSQELLRKIVEYYLVCMCSLLCVILCLSSL